MDKTSQKIKQLEKALFESEERLSIISDLSYDMLWEWNIAKGELNWIGDIDTFLGYEKNESPRTIEAWENILYPDDKERVLNSLNNHHNKKGCEYREKYRVFNKNGEIRCWDDRGLTRWDDNGKPLSMTGTITDITEKLLHEQKVSAFQKQSDANKVQSIFLNMLDQLPICFHLQSNDHTVPFANKMFKDRFGDPEKKKCYQLMHNREKPFAWAEK